MIFNCNRLALRSNFCLSSAQPRKATMHSVLLDGVKTFYGVTLWLVALISSPVLRTTWQVSTYQLQQSNEEQSRKRLLTLTFFSPILGWIPRHCLPFFLTLMRTFGSWATLEAGRNNVGSNLFCFLPYVLPYVFVWGILTGNHIQPTYVMNPGCKSLTRKTDYKLCVRLSSKHNYGQFHG